MKTTAEWEQIPESEYLWEKLQATKKTVVLYGMGNGADKILDVCTQKNIKISGIFASDGFKQGKIFHGMTVESRKAIFDRYGAENLIVLLAFATSRPDVLSIIKDLSEQTELYVPDVPVAGGGLFDRAFFESRKEEIRRAREVLSDFESKRIYDLCVLYKLTGKPQYLFDAVSDKNAVTAELVEPEKIKVAMDLGAYNGDTVRELLAEGARPERIYAVEADRKTFEKLARYAESEDKCEVKPYHGAAWDKNETLTFASCGNRGSTVEIKENKSQSTAKTAPNTEKTAQSTAKTAQCTAKTAQCTAKTAENATLSLITDNKNNNCSKNKTENGGKFSTVEGIACDTILGEDKVDYIKFDVEGAERKAISGLSHHIAEDLPTLLVSVYHRNEDLFALPLQISEQFPQYSRFYLRRFEGLPAWDLNLYVKK